MRRIVVVVLVLITAGCASASKPAVHRPAGGASRLAKTITARLVFPSRTVAAGSSVSGRVIVENNTGRSVSTVACGSLFQVALSSKAYHPAVAWLTCVQSFTIPVGRSTYRVTVEARRSPCPQGSSHVIKTCPLPPGDYHAVLFQLGHLVQAPRPMPFRVTPAAR
jgi:ribosomal 50S subunit-recycling heat shock protein